MAQPTENEITALYQRHIDMVYRVCRSFMKNRVDTEDMVQETFLKLLSCGKRFASEEHEKAWLIVTASNTCKDALKRWWRKNEELEACREVAAPPETDEVLSAILELPVDYKEAVYLYYYEGYSTPEIARMLRCPQSTVRNRLSRARKILDNGMQEVI